MAKKVENWIVEANNSPKGSRTVIIKKITQNKKSGKPLGFRFVLFDEDRLNKLLAYD